ncbi:alpha/beta hydrolase family domain-containing protein [Purpureocillium lavendulum]|uniref:1-alkyl-2-acetylglycerophosphocholine esterase n=1 Tax=Purpureocillium lavendulum TaxID=1247861 RepID=A0AB34FJV2_9HYPO|nr:alpha/beta hydrolase family domain-containing protein [Purpureocillium lavendulum]
MLAHALLNIGLLLLPPSSALLLPPPPGPFPVALTVIPLTDPSRAANVLSPAASPAGPSGRRRILVSVFAPLAANDTTTTTTNSTLPGLCHLQTLPYMTPGVAASYGQQAAQFGLPADLYSRFDMQTCDAAALPCRRVSPTRSGRHVSQGGGRASQQVVILTPGLAESRLLYSGLARALASTGLLVVTVDHPLEAPVVEFPDGSVVPGVNVSSEDQVMLNRIVQVRIDDISFLLERLPAVLPASLRAHLPQPLPRRPRALILGHSFGGTAAAAMVMSKSVQRHEAHDPRSRDVLAAVNLDGRLLIPQQKDGPGDKKELRGPSAPVVMLGRPTHRAEDPTWDAVWPRIRAPATELALAGAAHASFTDRPLLFLGAAPQLGLSEEQQKMVELLVGTIPAHRLEEVLHGVVARVLDLAITGDSEPLKQVHEAFQEVSVVRSRGL